jgi:pSer/pThr/pTyr-binding forkhead associated (FHA) protein
VLELLLVDPRSGARRRVALSTPVATLGSDLGCEVVLSAPEVARHHARIESTPFGWQLVRQGSGTPVRVNDTSVEKAPLQSGDVLRIGPFQLTVLSVAAPSAASPTRARARPPPSGSPPPNCSRPSSGCAQI